jgi:DNA-binding beta-propeller fold protein YncE
MKILIKRLMAIDNVVLPRRLLYHPSNNLFVLNYIHTDYFNLDRSNAAKILRTALVNEKTRNIFFLDEGLSVLEITTEGKIYSIKDDFSTSRSLNIYDSKYKVTIKNIPVELVFGYGNSCLLEQAELSRLYIAFHGSETGGQEGVLVIDTKEDRVLDQINLNGSPRILSIAPEQNKLFIMVAGHASEKKIFIVDIRKHKILDSINLNFYPTKALVKGSDLILLDPLGEGSIHILRSQEKEIVERRSVPEIFDIVQTENMYLFILLMQRKKPTYLVDRLAVYDFERNEVIYEQQISRGMNLESFQSGRFFFTETIDTTLFINEIKLTDN